jgi:Fe-S-cluster containining protein
MLLETDITRMARELSIPRDVFFSRYVRVMPDWESFILDNGEKQCPFLSWDQEFSKATCMIYHSRPLACRDFIASLSRHECQDGLKKLGGDNSVLLPKDIYSSGNKIKRFYSVLRNI